MTAEEVIQKLNLSPLPEEGGFYRQTYKDERRFENRSCSTAIYYLVTPEEYSALHAVTSTEIFHFYAGDPVQMLRLTEGKVETIKIGNNLSEDESPQVVVEPNVWQGTKLIEGGKWALIGCTVSPGFEFEDFSMPDGEALLKEYPEHQELIRSYLR